MKFIQDFSFKENMIQKILKEFLEKSGKTISIIGQGLLYYLIFPSEDKKVTTEYKLKTKGCELGYFIRIYWR